MSDAVLRMHGVRVERGRGGDAFRLEVPEVDLEAGAVLACIGPSGCGKTTLLHAATGILPVARKCPHAVPMAVPSFAAIMCLFPGAESVT